VTAAASAAVAGASATASAAAVAAGSRFGAAVPAACRRQPHEQRRTRCRSKTLDLHVCLAPDDRSLMPVHGDGAANSVGEKEMARTKSVPRY
jgi:hypothetical protein